MQLIVAIDGDRRQAEQLAALVRGRLGVELIQTASAGEALQALGDRVPDLIMTAALLSPFDDGVLAEYLRDLGPAAAHVQSLRIPVFGAAPKQTVRSLFSLRRKRPAASAPAGCDPNLFADEIALYLARAAEERQRVTASGVSAPAAPQVWSDQEPNALEWTADEAAPAPLTDTFGASESLDAVTSEVFEVDQPRDGVIDPRYGADPPAFGHEEPLYVRDEPLYLHEEPLEVREATAPLVEPAAPFVEPARAEVELAPAALELEPASVEEAPAGIEPAAHDTTPAQTAAPADAVEPEAPRTSTFEAALAAIRAAWAHTPTPAAAAAPPAHRPDDLATDSPVTIDAAETVEIDMAAAIELVEPIVDASAPPASIGLTAEEIYEISASPSLHDLEADLAAAGPPPARPSPATALAGAARADGTTLQPPARRGVDKPKKRNDKRKHTRVPAGRPVQDEWGIFDPDQCGFSAIVDKLDEVTESGVARAADRTTVRVISFS